MMVVDRKPLVRLIGRPPPARTRASTRRGRGGPTAGATAPLR